MGNVYLFVFKKDPGLFFTRIVRNLCTKDIEGAARYVLQAFSYRDLDHCSCQVYLLRDGHFVYDCEVTF